jgi:hypothetical protein
VVRPGSVGGAALAKAAIQRGLTLVDTTSARGVHTYLPHLPASRFHVTDTPAAALAAADLVLVCTKRTACRQVTQ